MGFAAAAAVLAVAAAAAVRAVAGEDAPHTLPFAPSALTTASGATADPDAFGEPEVCETCHVAQAAAWRGSLHSRSHEDALYLAFAKRAREEGGDALYRFCSGCHAPGAVATGEIPGDASTEHTFLTHDGVSCDICHTAARVNVRHEGGGANGSLVLEEGETRFGPIEDPIDTPAHDSQYSATHTQALFCSACHSLTHPTNGVVIENTFAEWKASPYAAAGIQCQDCHMRTVDQALEVVRTMRPVVVPGTTVKGKERPNTYAHLFVGGNVNGELVGADAAHVAEAEKRLRTVASMVVEAPQHTRPGARAEFVVAVTNVAAGHSLPTSITELRRVWIDVRVTDAAGREVFRSGALDEHGALAPGSVWFGSELHDADGAVTYLPWRAASVGRERLLAARETSRDTFAFDVPADAQGPLAVTATLRYRSAPQDVLDALFGKGALVVRTFDMTEARATVPLE